MDVKQAFQAMKSKPVRFWFCAQDEKGKPRLLFHPTQVPQTEIDKVLKTAKNKTVANGMMKLEKTGELSVITKTAAPPALAKGVQVVARESNVMPKAINLVTQAMLESKELGEHYKGEDKKAGWRADAMRPKEGESKEEFAKRQKEVRESDVVTTKYFNEAERKKAEVTFDKGIAKDAKGRALDDGQRGFVMDPKTGKTYTFDGSHPHMTADGKKQWEHHSSPLGGKAVGGAGMMKTDFRGSVTEISDQSGHYKPNAELTHQAVKHLDEQGALDTPMLDGHREAKVRLLDKNAAITDEQWQTVKGDKAAIEQQVKLNQLKGPLGEQAFAELQQKRPEELKKLLASGKYKTIGDLKAALGATALKKLEEEVKKDSSKLEAKAKELYAKAPGVKVPENQVNAQAYINLLAGDANASVTRKSQFIQSEGNEAQMRNKDRLNRELEEKQAKKRETLDTLAEKRAAVHDARIKNEQAKQANANSASATGDVQNRPGSYADVTNLQPQTDEEQGEGQPLKAARSGGYITPDGAPKKSGKETMKKGKPVEMMKRGPDGYMS